MDFIGIIPGFDPACCCPPDVPLVKKLEILGVACFPNFQANLHQRGIGARILALGGLLRAMRSFKPDIVHVNQAGATRIALMACRLLGVPCVTHVRIREDVEYLNQLRPLPKHLNHLVAISRPIADLIKAQPNLKDIPCTMILDAYDPKKGTYPGPPEDETESWKWDIACVGRFSDSKGQELFIRALEKLKCAGISPKVIFVGEVNECGKALQNLVAEFSLQSSVEFSGHRDDVDRILRQSGWLICPSDYEPLGRVVFEAWDAGTPVIAGAFCGGAADSITSSGGGLLFEEWNAGALATTLEEALSLEPEENTTMAEKGRAWLLQATHPKRYAEAIRQLMEQAIKSFKARV